MNAGLSHARRDQDFGPGSGRHWRAHSKTMNGVLLSRKTPTHSDGDVHCVRLTVRVPVHTLSTPDVRDVPVVAHQLDAVTTEVLIDGAVAGFIRCDGHHFVAMRGPALIDAVPCGTSELWDRALGLLYEAL